MEDLNYDREIMEVGSDEDSGSKHLELTETQNGRKMMEEGMLIDSISPHMEITPVIDDSAPIETAPPLFDNPHLDDGLQLEATTPVTELEPEPQPPEIDLTSFFVTDQVFESREAIIEWCQEVQANCEKAFEDNEEWKQFYSDWSHVWQAQTKDEYGDAYADLSTNWALSYPSCIVYLRDTWLIQKEKFVLAWTNKIKHFGNTTTKAENEHEKLRRYLGSAVDSYTTCWKAMHAMIKKEIAQIKSSFEQSLTTLKHEHLSPAFEELRNHVSHKALELVLLEISHSENIDKEESSCSCSLRATHGLPCAHDLVKYAPEGKAIPVSDIDPHWKQLSIVPIQELHSGFDVLPEYQLLRQKWTEAAEPERSLLLQKIKELATSKTRI
ncbi:hypothetical protein MKX01_022113 [Papaver californicum]|nr:hypothetical protein MKX01_022113 [Papaver californicum]